MKRLLGTLFAVGLVAALVVAVTALANTKDRSGHHWGSKTITVIEHADTDVTTDNPPEGDSPGDVLTFANEVFDETDTEDVGSDQGYCIRTAIGESYECNFTTLLAKGNITVEGPFYDAKDSVLSITGGTGHYRKARGEMELSAYGNEGPKFQFVFHITR